MDAVVKTNARQLTQDDELPAVGDDVTLARDVVTGLGERFESGQRVTVTRIERGEIYFGMQKVVGARVTARAADGRTFNTMREGVWA